MSSVSALGSSQYYSSPLQQLEAELQSEISDGSINSSDQSSLSSALTSINNSLTSDQSSSASQTTDSSGNAGPGDIKSKITSLIQAQVSNGALTSSQGTELQNLFNNTFGNGPGGQGDFGGPQGGSPPAPPPGPPPSASGPSSSSSNSSAAVIEQLLDSASSASTDSSSGDSSSTDDTLQNFLQMLQQTQPFSYGANGTTAAASTGSTLINYQV